MTVARFFLAPLLAATTAAAAEPQLLWSGPLYSEACTRLADNGMIESAAGARYGEITATVAGGEATLAAARTCASASAESAKLSELMNEDGPEWRAFEASFSACLADSGIAAKIGKPAIVSYTSCAWPG
ncbi:hypothetical protein sos41_28190 [Alphaproteobacteria bacterium SO-S41]|nr:hypothetical protein sos41_28190 [Alphaproteobacteria bacterium SO-S41]